MHLIVYMLYYHGYNNAFVIRCFVQKLKPLKVGKTQNAGSTESDDIMDLILNTNAD
jgi:hypothetical protein